jgi:MerR family redox-sensitive transcriptional activator SoxR
MDQNNKMLLTIGEVAQRADVRPSAIRFYEAAGLLTPSERRVGGQRRYDPTILRWLARIHVAQQAGLTIGEIAELFTGLKHGVAPSAQWRGLAERKLPEVRRLIRRAQEMERLLEDGLRCDCLDLGECRVDDEAVTPLEQASHTKRVPLRRSGWQRLKQESRAGRPRTGDATSARLHRT